GGPGLEEPSCGGSEGCQARLPLTGLLSPPAHRLPGEAGLRGPPGQSRPCRWCRSCGSGIPEGSEGVRDADLCLPLWPRGPGRAGPHLPQGPLPGLLPGLPAPHRGGPRAAHPPAGAAAEEAGRQRPPLQLPDPTKPAVLGDAAAGTGRHRQGLAPRGWGHTGLAWPWGSTVGCWQNGGWAERLLWPPTLTGLCCPFLLQACGVDYEIRAFCAKTVDEKIHKRNSVRLVIRKVQYAPEKPGPQPMAETTRHFLMSDRSLHLEASLDKELYYHGEPISINVHVTNNSSKSVKKVKVSVRQYADICLFSTAQYKCPVAQIEQDDQVAASSTFCKVYTLTPSLSSNREKRGLALDGKLKHEDTNLASSTIVKEGANKEVLGILVSYRVKVKLVVSRGGDVSVELPFVLMHPKPPDQPSPAQPQLAAPETDEPVDTNLIEFDTNYGQDDDIVFEDFARLRLKGLKDDKDDDYFC
uniref:Arrestin beta 2 n=1 Tax=Varanus komodoensis TaxID=61221 RepID=A0A8D2Q6E3_VARKO